MVQQVAISGGGYEVGEEPLGCLRREIKEELEIQNIEGDLGTISEPVKKGDSTYYFIESTREKVTNLVNRLNASLTYYGEMYDFQAIDLNILCGEKFNKNGKTKYGLDAFVRHVSPPTR